MMPFQPPNAVNQPRWRIGKVRLPNHALAWPRCLLPGQKIALAIILCTFALYAFTAGCASPGLPTPRHPTVPVAITDLSARQVGDTVILNFTLPTSSTDLEPLEEMPTIEIYRNVAQTPTPASKARAKNKNTTRLADTIPSGTIAQYQQNGKIEFPDKLDASELRNESGTEFVYTVRTRVSRAKSSADSNAVTVRVYPAPATVQNLSATLTETALVLDWRAAQEATEASTGQAAGFHIYRAEVDPTTADAAVSNPSQAKLIAPPALLAQTMETTYRDTNFQFGHIYFYTVCGVAQFEGATVESADSAPAVLVAKDVFPPAAPQGLEVVGVAAANGAPAALELTWTINTEPDLAGYNVYRSEEADTPGQKLNSELLLVPTFRDMSVSPGKNYFYRVGAVDQAGNESPLSSAGEASLPGP